MERSNIPFFSKLEVYYPLVVVSKIIFTSRTFRAII